MTYLNSDRCSAIAKRLVRDYQELLEELDDPSLTEEISDGLRLILENKIPCTMGLNMRRTYAGREAEAQAVREAIYNIGKGLCSPANPFFALIERQRKAKDRNP